MNEIIKISWIAKDIVEMWIKNGAIARKFQPGQFVIVRYGEKDERIPLTIVESKDDMIRLIIQKVGYSTSQLCDLKVNDIIKDVAGPLGVPSKLKNFGNVIAIAGGIGAAPLKPVALKLKELGNHLTIIEGVRSVDYLILKDELEDIADEFILTSDDGSVGIRGLVTDPLQKIINDGKIPDFVFAVGPPVMMAAVSKITKKNNILLTVSLNPIMVDGSGMCGACRVEVGGLTKFACVDGPEFDGNKVDFNLLINRLRFYEKEERKLSWQ